MLSQRVWVMGLHVWWIRGEGPSTAVVSRPHYFCSCLQLTSLSRFSHPLSTVQTPSILSQPHLWCAKLTATEKPSAPGCIFSSCVIRFYLHFMISHLEGKTEKSYFSPSALQGVEQILNSMKWSCQGLKAFPGPKSISLCIWGLDGLHLISCQQNPVLFRVPWEKEKKKKYKMSEMRGKYMSKDHFFAVIQNTDTYFPDQSCV